MWLDGSALSYNTSGLRLDLPMKADFNQAELHNWPKMARGGSGWLPEPG